VWVGAKPDHRPLLNDFIVPVYLEVGQELRLCLLCSLCSSNWRCSSADKVSQVGSIMLLGEISELSLEPSIEGRFDRSICVVPSGVAKSMLVPF
jgi:hypothetical protein